MSPARTPPVWVACVFSLCAFAHSSQRSHYREATLATSVMSTNYPNTQPPTRAGHALLAPTPYWRCSYKITGGPCFKAKRHPNTQLPTRAGHALLAPTPYWRRSYKSTGGPCFRSATPTLNHQQERAMPYWRRSYKIPGGPCFRSATTGGPCSTSATLTLNH